MYDKIKQLTLEGWFHLFDLHDDHKSPQLCLSYRKDTIIHSYKKMYMFPPNISLVLYLTHYSTGVHVPTVQKEKSSQDLKNRILQWNINIILQIFV